MCPMGSKPWKGAIPMTLSFHMHPICPKCANHKVEPVQCPDNKKACPKCPAPVQSDGRRRRSLEILAENGFGEGVARLWYAATKGAERQSIVGHSVYVSEGNDFRTEDGSIYAGKDLVAGKALRIDAWPGFGDGSAEFWFAKRARKTYKSNTLYLRSGDFTTQEGSISASDSLIAGKYLEVLRKCRKTYVLLCLCFWYLNAYLTYFKRMLVNFKYLMF